MKPPSTAPKSRLAQSLATASGALAAPLASTQAATVQITLASNNLTSTTNTLNADVTGDGTIDFNITGVVQDNVGSIRSVAFAINGGGLLKALYGVRGSSSHEFLADAQLAANGVGVGFAAAYPPQNVRYLNPLTFTDARINGGAPTQGYLEVNAFNSSPSSQTIALTRLVFDNASTTLATSGLSTSATYTTWTAVPEPSSLGLLALGAGGLLTRRRRLAA